MLQSLTEIEEAIRGSWSAGTCDPLDLPWSPSNAAKGQCGVTALVVQDLLGERDTVVRPPDTASGRLARQYRALADAVSARVP